MVDHVKNLGNFIEIEAKDNSDMASDNIVLIEKMAKELGLKKNNIIKGRGYPDLLLD